jgi:hypothetical protein
VLAGGLSLSAAVTTRDHGARAGASKTGFYLSADKRLDKTDVRLSGARSVGALRPGKSSRITVKAVIPKAAGAGAYYLLACADTGKRVRESSETNNCRASAKRLGLVAFPKPLTVHAAPDPARTKTATIGPQGGTLTATAADGTAYALQIPARALPDATAVTLTPLASLAGSPVASPHGVEIGPEGIHPLIPATLGIAPKPAVAAANRAAFAFEGTGVQFHLHPSSPVSGGFALGIPRFGGYGLGTANLAARTRIAGAHPPSTPLDQLSAAFGAGDPVAARARTAATAATGFPRNGEDALALITYMGMTQKLASPTLPAIESAMDDYIWWRPLALSRAGVSPELTGLVTAIDAQFASALSRAILDLRQSCYAKTDIQAIGQLTRAESYAIVIPQLGTASQLISSAISSCMRFSLDYEAEVNEHEGTDIDGDIVVDSVENPVILSPGGDTGASLFLLEGSLPLTVSKYSFFDYNCDQTGGTATPKAAGSVTMLLKSALPSDRYAPGHPNPIYFPPPTLSISFTHGSVETLNACGLDGFSGGLYDSGLPRVFADIHPSQFVLPDVAFDALGGAPQTIFDKQQADASDPDYSGRIQIKLKFKPAA